MAEEAEQITAAENPQEEVTPITTAPDTNAAEVDEVAVSAAPDETVPVDVPESTEPAEASESAEAPELAETPEPADVPAQPKKVSPAVESERKVRFDSPAMTFDEAQKEIDSIKARAGEVKNNLRSTPAAYNSSTISSSYSVSDDLPKSRNMLSHLTSESALLNYKAQTARALVRKQEDLLRNLARMRENMERSEVEIGKAANFYGGSRLGNVFQNVERRRQIRASSLGHRDFDSDDRRPISGNIHDAIITTELPPTPVASFIPAASLPSVASFTTGSKVDDEEKDFEKEIQEIKDRVASLSKRCYGPSNSAVNDDELADVRYLGTSSSRNLYDFDDPYEVNLLSSSVRVPRVNPSSQNNSYYDYLLSSLDDYPLTSSTHLAY